MPFLRILCLITLAFCLGCSDDEQYAKTMLWKIEGVELAAPSYLFGTIHITCQANLRPKVKKAIEATEVLVNEIHPDEIWGDEALGELPTISLPQGRTLHDYMSAKDYNMLRDYLLLYGGRDLDDYQTDHPLTLSVYRVPPELNCQVLASYEAELVDYAYINNKEFAGLETLRFQFEMLSNAPIEIHIQYLLKEARSELPASNNAIRLIQIHYNNEDLNGIQRILLSDKYTKTWRSNPELLDQRNHNWMPKIDSMAKARPTLFAVGAGHLVGNNGLIRLLEAQGYILTPVY